MQLIYLYIFLACNWFFRTSGLRDVRRNNLNPYYEREVLQDLVTWDKHSLFVRGERIIFFSGEFHPFRLPSPGLWLDVFQKVKALGFSGVSFYTYWGLLEGNPGHVITDGVFDLEPFFQAASEAGIYLLARPGPYINAETAAGGLPGWTLRLNGTLRSTAADYLNATKNYMSSIGKIIADAQITNGGPVILFQPENEYADWPGVFDFPNEMNREYMAFVEQSFRDAGIVVPFVVNDNLNIGSWAPGTGLGAVDLYGIDAYPMQYDCADPYTWPTIRFPTGWQISHLSNSPTTPFTIAEFQGGVPTGWGGVGQDQCAILVNNEAVRVLFKNNYSFGVTIFNTYMIYGGTNWGNLGYHGGDTSYDYGASITEDRLVWREKYSEMKLEANFLKVSPAYLTAVPGNVAIENNVAVTPLFGNNTNFYIIRQSDFTSNATTKYQLAVSTSLGNLTLPQLNGSLALNGRDSKIHVTDYDIGGFNMLYSTAEILTWVKGTGTNRVLVFYGGADETHEAAFPASQSDKPTLSEGSGVNFQLLGGAWVLSWEVTPTRRVVKIGSLEIHLLWRNEAYNYWVMELEAPAPTSNYTSPSKDLIIIKAGYLLRNADISGDKLHLTGDINATTNIEIISVPAKVINTITFNGIPLKTSRSLEGKLTATLNYEAPSISLPELSALEWKSIDSLPEIQATYDDSLWTACTNTKSNGNRTLTTPTSLYASDYGYHAGSLLYRGHFIATGHESSFLVNTTCGVGFAHSVWLNNTFLGSWVGNGSIQTMVQTFNLVTPLKTGRNYVLTILIDHMGQDEEAPGTDAIKFPRGILDYSLSGHPATDVSWRMTGNLGGEQYRDHARGPRNEGSLFAERQGFHLPNPPSTEWTSSNPVKDGISQAGVNAYTTSFELQIPVGWDIPISVVFTRNQPLINFRAQLFVNGYQFGKYVNNLGPQTSFPVPEGVLNHNGLNYIAITLWALDAGGAKIDGLSLVAQRPLLSGYNKPGLVPMPEWTLRSGAY